MKINWEKTQQKGIFEITTGFDSDIKFFFRITKLHGIETAAFNRLFSIRINRTKPIQKIPLMQRREGWM